KNIPFPIRRVYFMNNIKDATAIRGGHAHKKTEQAIFCANGSFLLHLDDGKRKQKVLLNDPANGIILGPKLWHAMSKFSKNCVVLVFASAHYNERDYIRDYDAFLKIAR
ncbi:MAG: FdtA/QdtA family cupin domain-containing protein, partial [Candidatus Liptonbacteria bacterium]|nr:FdtA/QdtA family cupin domain-containing protein [Candidatus Liptonbacteria bacterium]